MAGMNDTTGIEIRKTQDGPVYYIRVNYKGTAYRELIGPPVKARDVGLPGPPNRDITIEKANKRKKELKEQIRICKEQGVEWLNPREQKQLDQELAIQAQSERTHLLFEVAADRFLKACADTYARPQEVRSKVNNLILAFSGRYIDQIKRKDVLQYVSDRMNCENRFKSKPRTVGSRTPATEIITMSAMYSYLIYDEELELKNPCHGGPARRRTKKSEVYRPVHEAVIPTPEEREALFAADPTTGRKRVKPIHRCFWKVCYYTGARPESEAAQLTHGDVVLPQSNTVALDGKPALGQVTFTNTKTGQDRSMPLHDEAAEALRGIMLPEPTDAAKRAIWAATPIFQQHNGSPWVRSTYARAWVSTLGHVAAKHPRLAKMWVRDFRKAFVTDMRARGTDPAIAHKMAGHASSMSDHYTTVTQPLAVDAVLRLGQKVVHEVVHGRNSKVTAIEMASQ